eukprot:TRINITY_DN108137_c0_g1_i1.p1 TRINITY_DN108137_c0_g1~~TRINITY_DN108137_c0_g1_i1.p1  ORF type:complete len:401 (+),score=67.00 TRINITY_DN108137_c0_g1_i1:203-1405(+)
MTCDRPLVCPQEVVPAPESSFQGSKAGPHDQPPSTTLQSAIDGDDRDVISESEIANPRASTDPEQECKSNMASFDFLGTASCSKLVPAKSVFRRLKRRSLRSAASSEQDVVGERLRSLTKTAGPASGLEAVPEETPVVPSGEVQEPQHGESDEGQVAGHASTKGEESAKQERLELCATGLAELSAERLVAAASEAPRKRFTLPLASSRRRRSCDGSVFSVCTLSDSEDSRSSAGVSESSGSCQMIVPARRCPSVGSRHSSTAALDAMFERVKSSAAGSCTTSTTAESSRASSPGPRKDAQQCNATKPTLAGAARVLTQLCQEEATPSLEDRRPERLDQVEPRDMSEGTDHVSLRSKQSFSFCFPQHFCGIPLESTSQRKSLVYKNSGARRRRSRRSTDVL